MFLSNLLWSNTTLNHQRQVDHNRRQQTRNTGWTNRSIESFEYTYFYLINGRLIDHCLET